MNINDIFEQMAGQMGGMMSQSPIEYTIKIWIGDTIVNNQRIETTQFGAEQQFKQIVAQLSQESKPMRVRMSYDYYMAYGKINEDYIEFTNKLMDKARSESDAK